MEDVLIHPLTLFVWLHAQVRPSDNYACCIHTVQNETKC